MEYDMKITHLQIEIEIVKSLCTQRGKHEQREGKLSIFFSLRPNSNNCEQENREKCIVQLH